MLQVLDEADEEFIAASQNGKSHLRRLRAERRRLFRVYLYQLDADHEQLLAAIRSLVAESDIDRPDLTRLLYQAQFKFSLAMYGVEWQLFLHTLGLPRIDIRHLIAAADASQSHFRECFGEQ
jgi:hypothetical protein